VAAWIAKHDELLNGLLSSFLCTAIELIGLFSALLGKGTAIVARADTAPSSRSRFCSPWRIFSGNTEKYQSYTRHNGTRRVRMSLEISLADI
jgi:hypothetical protein